MPVAVIGAGSIGERHIRNLWQLGFRNIVVYRQRNLPFRDIENAQVKVVLTWQELLDENVAAAMVCTPTAQHLPQVMDCIRAGIHVLVEKPLWHKPFNKEALLLDVRSKNICLQVGYMLRYHPLLNKVKNIISSREFGSVVNIQTYWGEYLPGWHPWEDYRDSYAANRKDGGGAALTLSHDMDVVNWLMDSDVKQYQGLHNFSSVLEVDTESAFDLNLLYANNATAHVHVNFFQKVAQRFYKILLDDAVIDVDYFASTMNISTSHNTVEERLQAFDRNEMFLLQIQHFFEQIQSGDFAEFSKQQILNSSSIINICTYE